MAVALSTSVIYQNSTAATSHTASSITVPAGALALMVISFPNSAGLVNSVTNVTGGASWTRVGNRQGGTTAFTAVWYWRNNTGSSVTTTRTISINASAKISTVTGIFTGTHATYPIGNITTGEGTSNIVREGVLRTWSANSMVVNCVGAAGVPTFTNATPHTLVNTTATTGGSAGTNTRAAMTYNTTTNNAAQTTIGSQGSLSASGVFALVMVELQDAASATSVPDKYFVSLDSMYDGSIAEGRAGDSLGGLTQRYTLTGSTFGVQFDSGSNYMLRHTLTSGTDWERFASLDFDEGLAFHWGGTGSGSAFNNQEIVLKTRANNTVAGYQGGVDLRGSGATSTVQRNIQMQLRNGNALEIWRYLNSTTWVQIGSATFNYAVGDWVWLRFRANGSNVYGKAWLDGTSEPGSWMITGTTDVLDGLWFGPGAYSDNAATTTRDFDSIGVAVNGGTAPTSNITTVSAPTVTTSAASSILATSATGNGNVTSDGGGAITERGFVWSTSANPTTSDSKVTASGTTGSYTGSMTGLSPNTLYNYRAYAINSAGTSYGANTTFTTAMGATAPSVTSSAASSIAATTATLNGNVTNDNGSAITERGFIWSVDDNGPLDTSNGNKVTVAGTTGAYNTGITGLTAGGFYQFRAYAINAGGTSYGSVLEFQTLAAPTMAASTVSANKAVYVTMASNITSTGGTNATERGFVYMTGTSGDPTVSNTKVSETGSFSTGAYSLNLTSLTGNTSYRVRSFATNAQGTSYGTTLTVTTKRAVSTIEDLDNIRTANVVSGVIRGDFVLTRDLDFNDPASYANSANMSTYTTGLGFVPLGRISPSPWYGANFDGDGHVISNLMVNDTTTGQTNSGLFGVTDDCIIENVGLINPRINANATNNNFVQCGALIMGIDPAATVIVRNCFVKGGIVVGGDGAGNNGTGGLIGISHQYNTGKVEVIDCYVQGTIVKRNESGGGTKPGVGGLIGNLTYISGSGNANSYTAITRCYASAYVSAGSTSNVGGLLGAKEVSTLVNTTSSYWNTEISGQATSVAGTAKTDVQMKTMSTYSGWSIATMSSHVNETWYINQYADYPRLWYQPKVTVPLAQTLTDDFNDNSLDATKWLQINGVTPASETGGKISMTTTTAAAQRGIVSKNNYNLTGSYVWFEPVVPGNANLITNFDLVLSFRQYEGSGNDSLSYEIYNSAGTLKLSAAKTVGTTFTNILEVNYNATTHKYLRLREASGTVYFDYSADGSSWSNLTSQATPIPVVGNYIALYLFNAADTDTGTATIDNVNTTLGGTVLTGGKKIWTGSAWAFKPVKVLVGGVWTTKKVKTYNGSSWTESVD